MLGLVHRWDPLAAPLMGWWLGVQLDPEDQRRALPLGCSCFSLPGRLNQNRDHSGGKNAGWGNVDACSEEC